MKTLKFIFIICFVVPSFISFSQIKVNSSGQVGINNSSPTYQLDVNGDFQIEQSGTSVVRTQNGSTVYFDNSHIFTSTYASLGKSSNMWNKLYAWSPYFYYTPVILSDNNLKKEINDLDNTMDKLLNLRPVRYKMFSKKEFSEVIGKDSISGLSSENISQIGLIAQEVQEIFPEIVEQVGNGLLGIKYTEFIPLLVKGFQEQQKEITELKATIEQLENDCCNNFGNLKSGTLYEDEINININNVKLFQNFPNPYSIQTTIRFEIQETVQKAQLHICNMTGTLLKTININQRGKGSEIINPNEFAAGMYLYSLVIDGRIVDTKQMLLTE